jgi:hypothetical protein
VCARGRRPDLHHIKDRLFALRTYYLAGLNERDMQFEQNWCYGGFCVA